MIDYKKSFTHKFFRLGVLIKGVDGFIESVSGFILFFLDSGKIMNIIKTIFRTELLEDPKDLIANFLINSIGKLSFNIQLFAAVYLFVHGVIKLGLIIGLWKRKIKVYPWAIGIFIILGIYQIYQYFLNHSLALLLLTLLDVVVIVLTWVEYLHLKKEVSK